MVRLPLWRLFGTVGKQRGVCMEKEKRVVSKKKLCLFDCKQDT